MKRIIRVGTRQSKLALAQTRWVIERLAAAFPHQEFEIRALTTEGDRRANVPLDILGGKGVFVRDIEAALLQGDIDMAVHSMKDVPANMPKELVIGAYPLREDPRDILLTVDGRSPESLRQGAVVGTGSRRRGILLRLMRPDIQIAPLRGNVDTRIGRLLQRDYDGIILAAAGLNRLGLTHNMSAYLPLDSFIPAVGQGALGVQVSRENAKLQKMLACINHRETKLAVEAERAFLNTLEGNCRIPVGAHAFIQGERIILTGMLAYGEDMQVVRGERCAALSKGEEAGMELAKELLAAAGFTQESWRQTIIQQRNERH